MDEQEENMKDTHKVTHDVVNKIQDSISENIPFDLILEIVSRLPAKSILRFRCVSKLWFSFTKHQSFINSFASRSSIQPPNLLIAISLESEKSIFSFPQNHNIDIYYSPTYDYQMTDHSWKNPLSASVHGLILVDKFKIWNPSLRRILTVPTPIINIESYNCCFLGYDPSEANHKLLCLTDDFCVAPQILTLRAQEPWRIITKFGYIQCTNGDQGRCFNGILYYKAYIFGIEDLIMMSFDVKSETFNPITFPKYFISSSLSYEMIPYEGRLALVDIIHAYDSIDLHILKDENGDEWTHTRFVNVPFHIGPNMSCKGITNDGELIFVSYSFSGSLSFHYFYPKKNKAKETLFQGILSREKFPYELSKCIFPNHIESLVSF